MALAGEETAPIEHLQCEEMAQLSDEAQFVLKGWLRGVHARYGPGCVTRADLAAIAQGAWRQARAWSTDGGLCFTS